MSPAAASWPARAGRFLLREIKLLIPPTIYFFCAFNLIIFTTDLVARHYWFKLSQFLFATTLALIVGKVILVADEFSFVNRFRGQALIWPIVFRTIFYNVIVAVVRVFEQLIELARDERGFSAAHQAAIEAFTWHRFAAIQIWLFVSFLIYVTVTELGALLGENRLFGLLFGSAATRQSLSEGPER